MHAMHFELLSTSQFSTRYFNEPASAFACLQFFTHKDMADVGKKIKASLSLRDMGWILRPMDVKGED